MARNYRSSYRGSRRRGYSRGRSGRGFSQRRRRVGNRRTRQPAREVRIVIEQAAPSVGGPHIARQEEVKKKVF